MGNHEHLLVEPAEFVGLHYNSIRRIVAKGRKARQPPRAWRASEQTSQ